MDTEIKSGQKWVVFGRDYCRKGLVLFFKEIFQERPLGLTLGILEFEKLYSPQRRRERKEKLLKQFLPCKNLSVLCAFAGKNQFEFV